MTDSDPDPETDADSSVADLEAELAETRAERDALESDLEALRAERDALQANLNAQTAQLEAAHREFAALLVDAGVTFLDEDDLVERFEFTDLLQRTDLEDLSANP
ncbi:hypothetical protein [Halopelagius fulvigenes]|uniref:Uncharacterized protein n=1 Tax=Halopelagius fulvigenes TaxID=1198324 RepID=A0ABD5TS91_9EURY